MILPDGPGCVSVRLADHYHRILLIGRGNLPMNRIVLSWPGMKPRVFCGRSGGVKPLRLLRWWTFLIMVIAVAAPMDAANTEQPTDPAEKRGTIAFASDRDGNYEIYVMNPDGSGQKRLTNNSAADFAPSWSPDGKRIAFTSDRDGNGEIYLMNADGTGVRRLTNSPANDGGPSWSPDGHGICDSLSFGKCLLQRGRSR